MVVKAAKEEMTQEIQLTAIKTKLILNFVYIDYSFSEFIDC